MNREKWALIKSNKNFNVHIYRRGLSLLLVNLILMCFLLLLLFYIYLRQPEPDFYATNGVTQPMQLKPLATPNLSSNFLLEPDPPVNTFDIDLPQ